MQFPIDIARRVVRRLESRVIPSDLAVETKAPHLSIHLRRIMHARAERDAGSAEAVVEIFQPQRPPSRKSIFRTSADGPSWAEAKHFPLFTEGHVVEETSLRQGKSGSAIDHPWTEDISGAPTRGCEKIHFFGNDIRPARKRRNG